MILKNIELHNFRSYACEGLELSGETNVFYGENAEGKTNLLEAVYYLSCAKSFRSAVDRELIKHGESFSKIGGLLVTERYTTKLEAELFSEERKKLYANGVKLASATELAGRLKVVLFSPDDLKLVKDGAASRRRFMDAAFSQLRPAYLEALMRYNRVKDHKLRILREGEKNPAMLQTLEVFNEQLAEFGASLISYRARFMKTLSRRASEIHYDISGKKEKLSAVYKTVSSIPDPFLSHEDLKNALTGHLVLRRPAELASGSCLVGPHKDDISLSIDGLEARSFASQGQARTAALSLKLAERELFLEDGGEYPVLLLDDVLSELDEKRRDYVLNKISPGQVLITLCSRNDIKTFGGKLFEIKGGTARESAP